MVGAGPLAEVHYVCRPGKTHRGVERAVAKVKAQGCIVVVEGAATCDTTQCTLASLDVGESLILSITGTFAAGATGT